MTVAGNGQRGVPVDGAKATESPLVDPRAVAVDSKGALYILERSGHALRKVERDGTIRTVAGTGKKGNADGDALQAELSGPKHLCVDANDDVIIADTDNHVIRKFLAKERKVISIAGGGVVDRNSLRLDSGARTAGQYLTARPPLAVAIHDNIAFAGDAIAVAQRLRGLRNGLR